MPMSDGGDEFCMRPVDSVIELLGVFDDLMFLESGFEAASCFADVDLASLARYFVNSWMCFFGYLVLVCEEC